MENYNGKEAINNVNMMEMDTVDFERFKDNVMQEYIDIIADNNEDDIEYDGLEFDILFDGYKMHIYFEADTNFGEIEIHKHIDFLSNEYDVVSDMNEYLIQEIIEFDETDIIPLCQEGEGSWLVF